MTTAETLEPTPSPDFFHGLGGLLTAIFTGVGAVLAGVAALVAGLNKRSSKTNGGSIHALAKEMREANAEQTAHLQALSESNRAIVSRLESFEVRTTTRLDRLETDVSGLRKLQEMAADVRVAMERTERLTKDVERLQSRQGAPP